MYIEGIMSRSYYDLLIAAGYEPDWTCTTKEEAAKKDYVLTSPLSFELRNEPGAGLVMTYNKDLVITRIWIPAMDISEFITLEDLYLMNEKVLGLMAVSPDEEIRMFAAQKFKKSQQPASNSKEFLNHEKI